MSQHNQSKSKSEGTHAVHAGWTDRMSQWLIHQAAHQAPNTLSERLEEEWLADLETRASAFSRLRFAIGCCWATRIIAHEHQPGMVAVSTTMVAPKLVMAQRLSDVGRFSSQSSTFFLVLALHIVVFYAAFTTLSQTRVQPPPPVFHNIPVDRPPPTKVPTNFPPMQLNGVVLDVPPPVDFLIDPPVGPKDPGTVVAGSGDDLRPPQGPPDSALPPRAMRQVQGGPDVGFPNPDDYYPSVARNLAEQGVVTVHVCVNARGRLASDPTTLSSSGSLRLDNAALKLAKAGSGHYRASTQDGRAVDSCYPFRIRFLLKN